MTDAVQLGARPVRHRVPGAPLQPGQLVTVVRAVDEEVHDVGEHVGQPGRVLYLEYSCGCGQTYPGDPMIGVRLGDVGPVVEFWKEELEVRP